MKEKQTHNKHSFAKPENENISDEVKKIIEHHSAEYEQWAYRLKTNIRHTTAVMAVLLLAFVLYCVVPNPVSDAPLQPTATVAQQSRPPAVQHSEPVADTATMPTPKPAPTMPTAADRDCHAMYAAHKEPTAPTPVPDIIATAPIEQEHIPVLLAETETQIEIEQNLVAIDTAIDNINALHTDTILQLQKDLPKYEINYLAYIDIQSYNAGNRIYFCNTDCTNEYMKETVCEMINGI